MSRLRAFLLGGVDGVITSFAVAAGASLTDSPASTAAVVGFSSLAADGISMGVAEYLSSASEAELAIRDGRPPPGGGFTSSPLTLGITCFSAFVLSGCAPLLLFVTARERMPAAAGVSLLILLLLGATRGVTTGGRPLREAVLTTSLGVAAGAAAYGSAAAAAHIVDA
jgi:vacuolar iron transporter family protein